MIGKINEKFLFFSFFIFHFSFLVPPKAPADWYYSAILKSGEKIERSVFYGNKIYCGGEWGSVYSVDITSASPVANYITTVNSSVGGIVVSDGIVYVAGKDFCRVDPATGASIVLSTGSVSVTSLIYENGIFYLSDEDGNLWSFDETAGEKRKAGNVSLEISDLEFYDNSIFAVSHNSALWKFYLSGGVWSRDEIYDSDSKLYVVSASTFSGESRLYVGASNSRVTEIYYKNGWKKYPIDWTSGSVAEIVSGNLRGQECLYVFTTAGDCFEISSSTAGYQKVQIASFGSAVKSSLFAGGKLFVFCDDKYLYELSYFESSLSGTSYKHCPSGILTLNSSTASYRSPLFPSKDEEINFYFADSEKSTSLAPVLFWKATSTGVFEQTNFGYKSTESDYSVYLATLTISYSTGTIIEYYIKIGSVYVVRSGDDKLSNNSNFAFSYSSETAAEKTFKFILAGVGNCFHIPKNGFVNYSSMRMPLNPVPDDEICFYIANQASGSGNYGNMTGGKLNYKTSQNWQQVSLEWLIDCGDYKYWKATLKSNATFYYYFTIYYDDHNTTYVYGDDNNSYVSSRETAARANPFSLSFSTSFFTVDISTTLSQPMEILIFEKGTFKKAFEGEISSQTEISLYPGSFEMVISGGDFETIYDTFSFPSADKNFAISLSSTPHSVEFNGICEGDFSANEILSSDSESDSLWGAKNELYFLWTTFDKNSLYIGLKGLLDNNSLVVYIDCGDYFGNIADASGLPWSTGRNHKFPDNFQPDYQFISWNFSSGSFYRILSSYTLEDVSSDIVQQDRSATGELSELELKIPFSTLFYGILPDGIPAGEKLKLLVCVTGGDGTSAKDSIPDQNSSFGGTFDEFTFDKWFEIPLDSDSNGVADSFRRINDIAYSTFSAFSVLSQEESVQIDYYNRTSDSYFFSERDLPVYVFSASASSATLYFRNSSDENFDSLSYVGGSPTFTFTIPAEFVIGKIDYYFTLFKETDSVTSPVYSIQIDTTYVLSAGQKNYSFSGISVSFSQALSDDAEISFLPPASVLDDGIAPSNAEIAESVPVELYEIKGDIPTATFSLPYFDKTDEANLRAYFFDGERWILKSGSPDVGNNTISVELSQAGKVGIFLTTGISPTSTKVSSISKPVFNPQNGEKIEFNFDAAPRSVKIEIYDLNGRFVKKIDGNFWDGKDKNGTVVPSGAYVWHLKTESEDFWGMAGVWK
ncbi:MAG: hypothetical protein J7L54_00530 [Elusimicrobia bacterium]|nr:hypothetical protein [Elusimicrobiota bacterium]